MSLVSPFSWGSVNMMSSNICGATTNLFPSPFHHWFVLSLDPQSDHVTPEETLLVLSGSSRRAHLSQSHI